jgi:hypothetical protein
MSDDLPAALVARIERLSTSSVATMRATVYDILADAGVNVSELVAEQRAEIVRADQEAREKRAARLRLLQERLTTGRLTPAQQATALEQIATLDVRVKSDRKEANRVLKRMEARALPPPLPSAPTPERLRHWGEEVTIRDREVDGTVLAAPRHELRWALDRMTVALSAEEYNAATRLREAYLRRQSSPKGVSLDGAGGGVPGPRLPISDRQLAAGREWNAIWLRLPPALRLIVLNFICEEAPRGHERPMTGVEFGRLYGSVKYEEAARGVTRGAVKTACATIAGLFSDYDHWRAEKAREERRAREGRR